MSDEKVREIALGMFKGQLFTNLQLPEGRNNDLIRMVFMPLALMNEKEMKRFKADKPVLIWGDMADTFSRSINGYPIFTKVGYANRAEAEKIVAKYKEIKSAIEGVK
jgi:hypothetical protein